MTCIEALLQNAMYGVIYSYSPEVFPVKARGTGVGIASALGRILGATAPLLSGALIQIDIKLPIYLSAILFGFTGLMMLLLPIETRKVKVISDDDL
jgi:MFS family permease